MLSCSGFSEFYLEWTAAKMNIAEAAQKLMRIGAWRNVSGVERLRFLFAVSGRGLPELLKLVRLEYANFLTLKPFLSYRANFKPAGVYQNKKIFITNLKTFLNFLKLPQKNQQNRLIHLKFVITPNFIKPSHLLTKILKARQNWPKFHNNPGNTI